MKRETRANLWFLIVFVVISLPGAVILFHRKLDPAAARFDEPEGVLTSLPYMAPLPAPPVMKWVVPPKTLAWLKQLTRSRTATDLISAVAPGPEWEPVISTDHRVQVMSMHGRPNNEMFSLLIWDGSLPTDPTAFRAAIVPPRSLSEAKSTATRSSTDVSSVDSIDVPPDVRRELVGLGFVKPPARVLWVELRLGNVVLFPPLRFTIDCAVAPIPLHSTLDWDPRTQTAATQGAS